LNIGISGNESPLAKIPFDYIGKDGHVTIINMQNKSSSWGKNITDLFLGRRPKDVHLGEGHEMGSGRSSELFGGPETFFKYSQVCTPHGRTLTNFGKWKKRKLGHG